MRTLLVAVALIATGCTAASTGSASPESSSPVSPTPTSAMPQPGALTVPLPAGVQAVTVIFVKQGTADDVVYQQKVTDPQLVQNLVADVDALRQNDGATQGCSSPPVSLRLVFDGPSTTADLREDAACRTAVLTINGVPGPELNSALVSQAEAVVGVSVGEDASGQPSISPRQAG